MANWQNFASIKGRLTRDPEFIEQHGLLKFSVAVDNAGREDNAVASGFYDITAWTKPNDFTPKVFGERLLTSLKDGSLAKGVLVEVQGRLSHERFQTKDGQKASRVVIVADQVSVIVARNREGEPGAAPREATVGAAPEAGGSNDDYAVHEPF